MRNFAVFWVFLLLTLVITWPLVLHLNNYIIDSHDGLLITWIMNWGIHSLTSEIAGLQNILNANIFHPYANTLAFSDYHFFGALIALPFVSVFGEPLLAFNINFLLGFALTGFFTYLLVKHLTKREPVSFLAGVLLAFSIIHLNYMAHLQLFSFWVVILNLLFLLQNKTKLYILFFLLSVLNSPLNLYFLLLVAIIFKNNFRWTIVAVTLSAAFLFPYYQVSRQFGYTRPITDAINNSLQFPDLLNVSVYSRLSALFPQGPGTPAFLGGVFLALIFSLFLLSHSAKYPKGTHPESLNESDSGQARMTKIWLWIACVSFILALGPALHIFRNTIHIGPISAIPLPYAILYYLIPGFAGFRTPSRWIILTALALCAVVSIHFAKKITWPLAILLCALVFLEVNFPFKYHQAPSLAQFPPEQVWLKDHYQGAPIIQFPIYGWWDPSSSKASEAQAVQGAGLEALREYYSTIHFHPMVNGYSGYSPTEWENRVKWLQQNFPNGETIGYLRNLGVKLILMPSDWDVTPVQNELELVATFPQTNVYALNNHSKN